MIQTTFALFLRCPSGESRTPDIPVRLIQLQPDAINQLDALWLLDLILRSRRVKGTYTEGMN